MVVPPALTSPTVVELPSALSRHHTHRDPATTHITLLSLLDEGADTVFIRDLCIEPASRFNADAVPVTMDLVKLRFDPLSWRERSGESATRVVYPTTRR